MKKILILSNKTNTAKRYMDLLKEEELFSVELCTSVSQALVYILKRKFDLIICDVKQGTINYEEFFRINNNKTLTKKIKVLKILEENYPKPSREVFHTTLNTPFSDEALITACKMLIDKTITCSFSTI